MTDTATRTVHTPLVVPYSLGHDHWRTVYDGTQFRMHSRHQGRSTRFTVLFVGADGTCRLDQGGPRVPGPHAFLIAQATVISAVAFRQPAVVDLAEGDIVEIHGHRFEVRDDKPFHDPQLHSVHPHEGLTAEQLRSKLYELGAQIGDHQARIAYGDPGDADVWQIAVAACEHLRDDAAVRLARTLHEQAVRDSTPTA